MGTNVDYSSVAHKTIYDNITGGAGGGPVTAASDAWRGFAGTLVGIQEYVDRAVRGIGGAMEGAGADAATGATMPLVPWVDSARQVADQVAGSVAQQEELFSHTSNTVPPPRTIRDPAFSEDPVAWAADGVDWIPGVHTQEEEDRRLAQQDEQYARELMTGYQSNTNSNLATRPQFTPAPSVLGDLAEPAPGDVGVAGGAVGGGSYASSGVGGPVGGGYSPAPSPVSAAPQLAGGGAPGGAPGGIPTPPQYGGQVGSPGYGAGQPPVVRPDGGGFGPPAFGGGVAGGGRGAQPWQRLGREGTTGGRAGGAAGFRGGRYGAASAGGGFGPRPGGASGGFRAGDQAGGGRGGATAAGSSGAGAGARGGPGMGAGMAGMAGAGRGRGGEDSERQRPGYLVEQDPDAICGTLPPTLPAGGVVGEDPPQDYR